MTCSDRSTRRHKFELFASPLPPLHFLPCPSLLVFLSILPPFTLLSACRSSLSYVFCVPLYRKYNNFNITLRTVEIEQPKYNINSPRTTGHLVYDFQIRIRRLIPLLNQRALPSSRSPKVHCW